ncbi:MAG: LutC/YkgG family protein [Desulfocucumaceae bacterium]
MERGQSDLYSLFLERAGLVSARVVRVRGLPGAAVALADIIAMEKPEKIVADPSGMVKECIQIMEEKALLPGDGKKGPELHLRDLRRHAEDAGMGISQMSMCVAETGSIAGDCTSIESRLVSTLPPVHVALVPGSGIVASPAEAIEKFYSGEGEPPGYLSFISGPSRTADIERVLTIGVHGPEKLYVVLVDEEGGAGAD